MATPRVKRGPRQLPRRLRFFARVDVRGPDECWVWLAGTQLRGYGHFYDDDRRNRRAHRVAVELATGVPLADEVVVLHSCDNPPCVNARHLKVGTQVENLEDMRAKGRGYRFTADDVRKALAARGAA